VGQPSEITVSDVTVTDVNCNGESNGAISITPGGGTPPYTFEWSGQVSGTASTDENPSGLSADTYSLTITDNAGCSKIFDDIAVVSEPDPIVATITLINHVRCFGESNGSAEIDVTGGTAPYDFVWTAASGPYSSAQEDPTEMPADTYSLEITDGNGCIQNFPGILVITEPDDITANLDGFTDVSCFGGADGSAQVTVSNGTPGYTYLWTGTGTGHTSTVEDPTDLIEDTYDLEITDANSCTKDFNAIVTIDQPTEISVTTESITDIDCFGENTGAIDITTSGGTAPYTFSWSSPDGFTSEDEDISKLYAGDYTVIVTDNNGCTKMLGPITVGQPSEITVSDVTVTDVNCNGESNGAISITPGGGTPPYTF
ncbi:MAG: SprB repeat-containing protein, partial [Bacteroidales bacterium]|nr:SprB repeat-containing protein [Bacteroidales bacterium]